MKIDSADLLNIKKAPSSSIRKYRQCSILLKEYESKIYEKGLSDEDFFQYAIKYEYIDDIQNCFLFEIIDNFVNRRNTSEKSWTILYYRKILETLALFKVFDSNLMQKINYRIFKIKNFNTTSKKEMSKLANSVNLTPKVLKSILNSPSPSYLLGVLNQYNHPLKLIQFVENKEDNLMFSNAYNALSLFVHQASENRNAGTQQDILTSLINSSIFKNIFNPKELKSIKKLEPLEIENKVSNNDFLNKFITIISQYNDESLLANASPDEKILSLLSNYISIYQPIFEYSIENLLFLLTLFALDKPITILVVLKTMIEKCSLYNDLLNIKDHDEALLRNEAFKEFSTFSFIDSIKDLVLDSDLNESLKGKLKEERNKTVKDIYKKLRTIEASIPKTFEEFLKKVNNSPKFVITKKDDSYSNSVMNFLKDIYKKDDENEVMPYYLAYLQGVGLSHSEGKLIFAQKNLDYYRYRAIDGISVIFSFVYKLFDEMQGFAFEVLNTSTNNLAADHIYEYCDNVNKIKSNLLSFEIEFQRQNSEKEISSEYKEQEEELIEALKNGSLDI